MPVDTIFWPDVPLVCDWSGVQGTQVGPDWESTYGFWLVGYEMGKLPHGKYNLSVTFHHGHSLTRTNILALPIAVMRIPQDANIRIP